MRALLFFLLLLYLDHALAQDTTSQKLSFSGYGEIYYSYDFANPRNNERPFFIYNHKRHNEVNANLIIVKCTYADKTVRGNVALMAGNYAQYNLSSEPTWAQFVYEANVGVKLSKTKNIWVDAGIMPSHIGFESAISADCWNLTRSLQAENSPYYESGVKLSYRSTNNKLYLSALYLNGWQRIRRLYGLQRPSFGFQCTYRLKENVLVNYSNFIGTVFPNRGNAIRYFHNMYVIYEPLGKYGITAGFDLGSDRDFQNNSAIWYSPVLIVRRSFGEKTRVALRGEYYFDKDQVVIYTGTANGFQTMGISSNIDYVVSDKVMVRLEGKMYHSKDRIFRFNENNNFSITSNITISF